MSTNTGGPAFPWTGCGEEGMTLRDYFAAKAMQGLVVQKSFVDLYSFGSTAVALQAYLMADAMLAARSAT